MTPDIEKTINKAMDDAYDKGISHAIEIVRQKYLEDSPLWNRMFDSIISQLQKLKTKEQ